MSLRVGLVSIGNGMALTLQFCIQSMTVIRAIMPPACCGSAPPVQSLLLTGDLEQRVERMLVAERGDRLRSDILVAGHHGSATSTSTAFLAAVDPAWVLYSSGYANRWGFPVASVRERVQTQGARVAGTAMDGALSFVLPATGALSAPQRARDQDRRIWRHRPER